MEEISRKTNDLTESFNVNQVLIDNKTARYDEEIKTLKKLVYEKDSEVKEKNQRTKRLFKAEFKSRNMEHGMTRNENVHIFYVIT